jgi:hypothetical protein
VRAIRFLESVSVTARFFLVIADVVFFFLARIVYFPVGV